jgi:hypothetical protein
MKGYNGKVAGHDEKRYPVDHAGKFKEESFGSN